MARTTLEEADAVLIPTTESGGLMVVGFRERRVVTLFGDVRIRRRLYRDNMGKGRYLLDEAMGLEKRSPLSAGMRELSALLSSYMPFGKCERLLRMLLPTGVSHTTVHRQVGKITEPILAREDEEIVEVFERGKAPEAVEKEVPLLFLEGDGVSVALQREEERRAEVKVGIAYEGWEEVGSRYRLKDKTVYLGLMDSNRFWEGFSLTLARKYNLGKVGQVVVGGDGANWVRKGAELSGGMYQLDRFHLRRAMLRGLGNDPDLADAVYRARRRRMKKRVMRWTRRGIRRMTRLIQMQHEGQISNWKTLPRLAEPAITQEVPRTRMRGKKRDEGAWLNMDLPALRGPHQNRSWVLGLDHIAHGSSAVRAFPLDSNRLSVDITDKFKPLTGKSKYAMIRNTVNLGSLSCRGLSR